MTCLLDTVVGGVLPYVYCNGISLQNNSLSNSDTDVILSLDLYLEKNSLFKSNWLNSFSAQNVNLMDSLYIQVLHYSEKDNVKRMMPSNQPLSVGHNVYTAGQFFQDNYLPRGTTQTVFGDGTTTGKVFQSFTQPPKPMRVSVSSLLDKKLSNSDILKQFFAEGNAREEIIDGKPYYAIPFEYKTTYTENMQNLGFVFYVFLHVPSWVSQLEIEGIDTTFFNDFFEQYIIEGPVNTEIVFLDGALQQTREVFFLPNGLPWYGAVHLHGPDNPDPSGYQGDGGLSGLSPAAPYRGWMVGEAHNSPDLPKLRLAQVPNNIISDFRSNTFLGPNNILGMLPLDVPEISPLAAGKNKIEEFLSPFQKEKRKDFISDNDAEFSKLYICRDKENVAHGLFFINTRQLLYSHSSLFSNLFDQQKELQALPGLPIFEFLNNEESVDAILKASKILELKIYRDRVKKNTINSRNEKFSNDTVYEEPSQLIGTIFDNSSYQTPNQNFAVAEITGLTGTQAEKTTRYFMFSDREVGDQNAGLYQYRIELNFKDGTYAYLYDLYVDLNKTKILLDEYYDLATSSYTKETLAETFQYSRQLIDSEAYEKAVFKRYFKNGSFTQPEFRDLVENHKNFIDNEFPWLLAPAMIDEFQRIFGLFKNNQGETVDFQSPTITNLLSPNFGSPQGIEYFSRIIGTAVSKLETLLAVTKINRSGGDISNTAIPQGYTYNNMLDIVVSPGDFTITDEHTFDRPSELFEAISNENIYSDYLSIGSPLGSPLFLRTLSTEYFRDRCQMETAKLTHKGQFFGVFNGDLKGGAITYEEPSATGKTVYNDTFSNSAYSYLAPSIVELADAIDGGRDIYRTFYSAFLPYGTSKMYLENNAAGPGVLHHPSFTDILNYDDLFLNFLNYTISKNETIDADLLDAFYIPAETDQIVAKAFSSREAYKKLFENLSLTFHQPKNHDLFFGSGPHKARPAGANSMDISPDKDEFPLELEDFSDVDSFPKTYLQNFLYNKKQEILRAEQSFSKPKNVALYSISLPNSFKIPFLQAQSKVLNGENIVHDSLVTMYENDSDIVNSGFFFFQNNLIAKIEVFRGIGLNSKDDTAAWTLLEEDDLNLSDDRKLFCRLVLYDEKMKYNLKMPVLDKYFLIYNDAPLVFQEVPLVQQTMPGPDPIFDKVLKKEKPEKEERPTLPIPDDPRPKAESPRYVSYDARYEHTSGDEADRRTTPQAGLVPPPRPDSVDGPAPRIVVVPQKNSTSDGDISSRRPTITFRSTSKFPDQNIRTWEEINRNEAKQKKKGTDASIDESKGKGDSRLARTEDEKLGPNPDPRFEGQSTSRTSAPERGADGTVVIPSPEPRAEIPASEDPQPSAPRPSGVAENVASDDAPAPQAGTTTVSADATSTADGGVTQAQPNTTTTTGDVGADVSINIGSTGNGGTGGGGYG